MLSMIRDYLIMVLVKLVIASVIFGLCLLGIFIAYWVFCDYTRATMQIHEIMINDFTKVVLGFISLLCLFQDVTTGNNNGNAKKFYKKTEKYFEMYDTAGIKW